MERLPFEVELAVFRMVQESLTNVYRHSGSPRAEIEIRRDGARLEVEVRDQGHGIPSAAPREADLFEAAGVGMAGMRERLRSLGGELEIESSPQGTRVMARIPNAPSVTSSSPFQLTHE
jgi:signal transduction histidine kinase